MTTTKPIKRIAMIGNHTPRQCGISTFTADLMEAISSQFPQTECFAIAMNDRVIGYEYPKQVHSQIAANNIASYQNAAEFLNTSNVDVVCLQHEYGIFGGEAGSHVLTLLRALKMPLVTILHTILAKPSASQYAVLAEIVRLSDRIIVMSQRGSQILQEVHGVDPRCIDVIPHGIPTMPPLDADFYKAQFGLKDKSVLLTFGLLSPDKGIENVIHAMPAILKAHPDTVYVILGATHPHIIQNQGESYRESLVALAEKLGVSNSVQFHNHFVPLEELTQFLSTADIYITPYLKPEQITSGTLAYAVGNGKAAISTPYLYAEELLAEGRGILVPFRDPAAIAHEVVDLLGDPKKRAAIQARAYTFGRQMIWPAVAQQVMQTFENVHSPTVSPALFSTLPAISLRHLQQMTDNTGMFQHATYDIPNRDEGYCVDDNARALLLMMLLPNQNSSLTTRYLSFVQHAFNPEKGRFRNFLSYDCHWLEEQGSEDSHGRTLWALGNVIGRSTNPGWCQLARDLFHAALPAVTTFTSPRACAYTLLGIDAALANPVENASNSLPPLMDLLGNNLLYQFQKNNAPNWPWLEDSVTYANARLSQALIVSGKRMKCVEMSEMGIRSLRWLSALQKSPEGKFSPIGSEGFYVRGGKPALFDQQPIEACGMVGACLDAFRVTHDPFWSQEARCAFDWFLGKNVLNTPLYNAHTGGCGDGLHADRVNENQGAESTLSYLQALCEMQLL